MEEGWFNLETLIQDHKIDENIQTHIAMTANRLSCNTLALRYGRYGSKCEQLCCRFGVGKIKIGYSN